MLAESKCDISRLLKLNYPRNILQIEPWVQIFWIKDNFRKSANYTHLFKGIIFKTLRIFPPKASKPGNLVVII